MRIGIYTPYLDTFGGGERYFLTIAEYFAKDHQVDLLLDRHLLSLNSENLMRTLSDRLNLNLSKVNLVEAPLGSGSNFLQRLLFFKRYDYLFCITDGSIFYSSAKNSILHFQVPFENNSAISLWGRFKLKSWKLAIYNSNFTKEIVEKSWPIHGQIIYPPVDINSFKPLNKKKIILSVGRFFGSLHNKKQKVLVETFIKLVKGGLNGWKLQLAGGTNPEGEECLKEIRQISKGLPLAIFPNITFENLQKLYGEASIYWHAAGFEEKDPKKMEHFGITTVEAMSAGCVPVVINSGGQKEIVEQNNSGYLWDSIDELENYTLKLINNKRLLMQTSQRSILRSKVFSKEKFCQKLDKLVRL